MMSIKDDLIIIRENNSLQREIIFNLTQPLFKFDWQNYQTAPVLKQSLDKMLELMKRLPLLDEHEWFPHEKKHIGKLYSNLGAFYNHIKKDPDAAISNLSIAQVLVKDKELAWVKNQIAFAFQQKLAASRKANDAEGIAKNRFQAFNFYAEVLSPYESASITDIDIIKIVGFAVCVKALTEYESGFLADAIEGYRQALELYEKNDLCDDQYARAKNRYAQFLAEQNKHEEALKAFNELLEYWAKQDGANPYAARFYVSFADYLMQRSPRQMETITELYQIAYDILKITEGEKSEFTQAIAKKLRELKEIEPQNSSQKSNLIAISKFKPAPVKPAASVKQDDERNVMICRYD